MQPMPKVGEGEDIHVLLRKQEARYIADKFNISGPAAAASIRSAGPNREKVYGYIRQEKNRFNRNAPTAARGFTIWQGLDQTG